MTIGTMMLSDLLAGQASLQTVQSFGLEKLIPIVQADFAAHNAIVQDMTTEFADPTTERLEASGVAETMQMYTADEFSRVPTQKTALGQNMGYPLDKQQIALAWTAEHFRQRSVQDFAKEIIALQKAHIFRIYRELKRALFRSANYDWVEKYQAPYITIPVKRLYNADGWGIPTGPHGEAFDGSTHTHYLAVNGITAPMLLSAINTVLEHRPTASMRVVIGSADRTAVSGLAGFSPFPDPRFTVGTGVVPEREGQPFDMNDVDIGYFGPATVAVKPWGLTSYPVAYDQAGPKPLKYRQRPGMEGLQLVAENDAFPLHVRYSEAHFGFGVGAEARGSAAVLYTGGGSYVDPTFA